jgi:hypothetical protein
MNLSGYQDGSITVASYARRGKGTIGLQRPTSITSRSIQRMLLGGGSVDLALIAAPKAAGPSRWTTYLPGVLDGPSSFYRACKGVECVTAGASVPRETGEEFTCSKCRQIKKGKK